MNIPPEQVAIVTEKLKELDSFRLQENISNLGTTLWNNVTNSIRAVFSNYFHSTISREIYFTIENTICFQVGHNIGDKLRLKLWFILDGYTIDIKH